MGLYMQFYETEEPKHTKALKHWLSLVDETWNVSAKKTKDFSVQRTGQNFG